MPSKEDPEVSQPLVFSTFEIKISLSGQVQVGGATPYNPGMQSQQPTVVVALVKCEDCGALLAPNSEWQHQQWHDQVVRLKR